MKTLLPMERSLAHAALSEVHPTFRSMEIEEVGALISEFLAAWQESAELNMYTFAQQWIEM